MRDINFHEKLDFRTLELVNRKEMARILNISERKLSTMMTNREIPFFKIGRSVRFNIRDVCEALQRFIIEAD
jgi:excisionase family DNA binding protein